MKKLLFVFFACLPLISIAQNKTIKINVYEYKLPEWWDSININIPDSLYSLNDIDNYIQYLGYYNDTTDFKKVIKIWALGLKKTNVFPIYLANVFADYGHYTEAKIIYSDLYELSPTQKGRQLELQALIPLKAGRACENEGNLEEALDWYRRGTDIKFYNSNGLAHSYYQSCLESYKRVMSNIKK